MLIFSARGSTLLRYSVDTIHLILKIVVFLGVGVEVGFAWLLKKDLPLILVCVATCQPHAVFLFIAERACLIEFFYYFYEVLILVDILMLIFPFQEICWLSWLAQSKLSKCL